MSDQVDLTNLPPVGEEVHMPEPSALPLINAAALAPAIVSITVSWWLVGSAMIIFLGDHGPLDPRRPARHREPPARPFFARIAAAP